MELISGDILTVKHEIISSAGRILFNQGAKVEVDEVIVKPAFWGKMTGQYYPEEIEWIKLVGFYGHWSLETFKETEKNQEITRKVLIEKIVSKTKIVYG